MCNQPNGFLQICLLSFFVFFILGRGKDLFYGRFFFMINLSSLSARCLGLWSNIWDWIKLRVLCADFFSLTRKPDIGHLVRSKRMYFFVHVRCRLYDQTPRQSAPAGNVTFLSEQDVQSWIIPHFQGIVFFSWGAREKMCIFSWQCWFWGRSLLTDVVYN